MGKAVEVRNEQAVTTRENAEIVKSGLGSQMEEDMKRNNYIPFEDFAKYHKKKKAQKWSYDDFEKAMHHLSLHKRDKEDIDNPKLCKESRRRFPCYVIAIDKESSDFGKGETTTYFIKGGKGHWSFRYDNFTQFQDRYFKQINKLVTSYVTDRVNAKAADKAKKEYMKEHGLKTEVEFINHVIEKGKTNG